MNLQNPENHRPDAVETLLPAGESKAAETLQSLRQTGNIFWDGCPAPDRLTATEECDDGSSLKLVIDNGEAVLVVFNARSEEEDRAVVSVDGWTLLWPAAQGAQGTPLEVPF